MKRKTLTVMVSLALSGLAVIGNCQASGYVVDPPARAVLCKQGENKQCDNASVYNADAIMAPQGASGFPVEGKLASGGLDSFRALNLEGEQWKQSSIAKGELDISWQLTSPTNATGFKYYLTQPDWQQSLDAGHRLTRASFEAVPFCEVSADPEQELQGLITHHCRLPERDGHQLIYAVANLAAPGKGSSLYNVIDVNIDNAKAETYGVVNSQWNKEIATIDRLFNDKPLKVKAGDRVRVRFFDSQNERVEIESQITILAGEESQWSYYVAKQLNEKFHDIRAGVIQPNGQVAPEEDRPNSIYVGSDSALNHAEISFN
ncbi:GlcNAc-binding protein A precursor [Serratia ficaria]|nr:GlcNAc-binding protein A precursor [Serratia ficaria]